MVKRRSLKAIQRDWDERAGGWEVDVDPSLCLRCGSEIPVTKQTETFEGKPAVIVTLAFECPGGCKKPLAVVA